MARALLETAAMRTWFLAVAIVSSVTGCGTAGDAARAVDEPRTAALHGTWRAESGEARPATVTVEQRALSARLTVELEGHACLAESVVETELTMDGVKTTADVAGMHLELEGGPGLEELFGNFEALRDGPCHGQGGWLSVYR